MLSIEEIDGVHLIVANEDRPGATRTVAIARMLEQIGERFPHLTKVLIVDPDLQKDRMMYDAAENRWFIVKRRDCKDPSLGDTPADPVENLAFFSEKVGWDISRELIIDVGELYQRKMRAEATPGADT